MRIPVTGFVVVIGGILLLAIVINALARGPDGSNENEQSR